MVNIRGKVALITGAGSGIGEATAIYFASKGCYLALNGRTLETLHRTRQKCVEQRQLSEENVLIVVGDVTKDEDVVKIVDTTVTHFGKMDILINNAGLAINANIENSQKEHFDSLMETNFTAAFRLIQTVLPHLKKTKGNVVNVSSVTGICPTRLLHAYGASKAALNSITKTIALEVAPHQVRVNAVCPGYVLTEIFEKSGITGEKLERFMQRLNARHPVGRIAHPHEIAKPIAFLCSDDASFVTGTILNVDGGYSLAN